jgi:hypothetical protein
VAERAPLLIAEATVRVVRAVARVVPARLKKRVEDGVFHYIFQKTRVENDAYGWRPPPAGGAPPAGEPQSGEPPSGEPRGGEPSISGNDTGPGAPPHAPRPSGTRR